MRFWGKAMPEGDSRAEHLALARALGAEAREKVDDERVLRMENGAVLRFRSPA